MVEQAFDDDLHLFALDDGREGDGVTKTFVNDTDGGVGMEVTRAGFRLRTVNFIDVVTVLSVIGNENEINGKAIVIFEQIFGKLSGEGLVDEFLESGVFGKGLEDRGGDGVVIGSEGEIAAGGEKGLNAAKGAKQDVDEDSVVAFCAVVLFFEQIPDGMLEIVFDNLITFGKIFP